jgi:lysophospholipase L1-like esterase
VNKTLKRLAFSLVTVLIFFGGLEITLRVLDIPAADENPEFAHQEVYWRADADQVDKPNFHKELGTSFSVSTDANGLRPPHHGVDKPDGAFRIMAMGCSTTYGWGVADADSYPAQLERILVEQGHDVQVINAGQPGYSTFQGMWLWDQALADYDPDLVLLGFVVQDAREVAYSDKSQALMQDNAEFLKQNVLYKLNTYRLLKEMLGGVQTQRKEQGQVFRVGPDEYVDNLRVLRAKIEANGGQAAHFGYPLEVEGYTELHRQVLKLEAEAGGLPYFDPSPEIADAVRQGQQLYFAPKDPGHANAAGNRKIAELVAEWLVSEGLVP